MIAVAAVAVVAGIFVSQRSADAPVRSVLVGEQLDGAQFTDLSGRARSMSEWHGKVVLVNFWATWCAPCREEIPALQETRAAYMDKGFEVVGIALDRAELARGFAADFKIDYPVLIGEGDIIDLMRALGNKSGALPYSVVIDRQGRVSQRHLGLLSAKMMRDMVEPVVSR
ncbi:MAG: TlpA family protein disulfide reductase [Burkholderiales bacterium]